MLYSHWFFNFAQKQDYKMEENQWQQLVQNLGLNPLNTELNPICQ